MSGCGEKRELLEDGPKKTVKKNRTMEKKTTKQYKKFAKSTCRKLASHERNFETHWITGREH